MKNLIVYYSWTGSTREAAEAVAQAVGGELFEVTETGRRSKGKWGFLMAGFQAIMGIPSRIREQLPDPKRYDAIYIGTPVWASNSCTAFTAVVNAWVGKTGDVPVHVFAVMADPQGNDKVEVSVQKKLQKAGIVPGAYA